MNTKSSNLSEGVSTSIPTNNSRHRLSCVPAFLPNGIALNGKPVCGVDWSRSEVIISEEEDKPVSKFKTLADAAPHYKGYVWVLESTADSFELQNRQIDLDAIKEAGIEAYCFKPKFTSCYRIQWGDIAKTDEADSRVIRRIFLTTNITCGRFKQITRDDPLRIAINKAIITDRQYEGEYSVATAKKYIPSFIDTPAHFREFLYDAATIKPKNPQKAVPKKQIGRLLMAAELVRKDCKGYRTFRRQVGNFGQGYGCMLRSEYYHWLVRIVLNARMKKADINKTTKESHVDPKTKENKFVRVWTHEELFLKKQVMKDMEAVLKWLWKLTNENFSASIPIPTTCS